MTIPNPESDDSPLPPEAAMPIPSASTRGTVTGPVVTAPQSQARPRILARSGFHMQYIVRPIVGMRAMYIIGFKLQL